MNNDKIVEIINGNDFSIIKFFNFIDVSTIEKARVIIAEELPNKCAQIIIDLENTDFLDSHGVGFFVSLLKRTHARNGHLFFSGAHDQPLSVLKMVGFNGNLVTYCDNVKQAADIIQNSV